MKTALISLFIFCTYTISYSQEEYKKHLTTDYPELDKIILKHFRKGQFQDCIPYTKAAQQKALFQFGRMDSTYTTYTSDLGYYYMQAGYYLEAEPQFIESIDIYNQLPINNRLTYYAQSLNNLGYLYINMGRYEEAEPLYIQAKNIKEKTIGVQHQSYALALNNLAGLYLKSKDYNKAKTLYEETLAILENTIGNKHQIYATPLQNLAWVCSALGQKEEAIKFYKQAKTIIENTLGKDHYLYSYKLHNLASEYEEIGNYSKAEKLLLEALEIKAHTEGKKHPSYLTTLNSLAHLYITMGEFEKAWNSLNQATVALINIKTAKPIGQNWADSIRQAPLYSYPHIEQLLNTLENIYDLLLVKNKNKPNEQQLIITDLALSFIKKSQNDFISSEDKLQMFEFSEQWMLFGLHHLDLNRQKESAFELIEQNKSVLLFQATKASATQRLGNFPDSLFEQENRLQTEKSSLEASILEDRKIEEKDSLREQLHRLNIQINTFRQEIKNNYPNYAKLKYPPIEIKAKDIQVALDNKTAILEYVVGEEQTYIVYIDKNNLRLIKQPISQEILNTHIESLHFSLSNYALLAQDNKLSYKKFTQNAYWLYQNLLAPVLENISDINHLIIVPDGELGHLPFETFLVEQAPSEESNYKHLHYLLKDYNISYSYSAGLWKENNEKLKQQHNKKTLAIAANYAIRLDSSNQANRLPVYQRLRKNLNPLPAARTEIEKLSTLFQGSFIFDTLASEKVFKELAPQYGIIHLAMHGILDRKDPMMSSIAFTEDSDLHENNFLHAYEISKLKLNADLVVLSACETGYGRFEKGNGIASLARAFMYAGIPSMIASLWQVNDASTAKIMQDFYQILATGSTKDKALRQAKLTYLENAKGLATHPAFWSPFVLLGNNHSISIAQQNEFNAYIWIGGGILFLFSIVATLKLLKRNNNKEK
ncbi:MAG: CHAT domain-containing protein [Aureispira sp.]|nr:CHAT domain-containing protein [Aureispira sp.]